MDDTVQRALESLKESPFRSGFTLSRKDLGYLHRKGIKTIRQHAVDFITSRIAPRHPRNDGRQTPMRNHPVFTAQHATATCCRNCIRKWHGIEKGRALTGKEVAFLVDLIMAWIQRQRRNELKRQREGATQRGPATPRSSRDTTPQNS